MVDVLVLVFVTDVVMVVEVVRVVFVAVVVVMVVVIILWPAKTVPFNESSTFLYCGSPSFRQQEAFVNQTKLLQLGCCSHASQHSSCVREKGIGSMPRNPLLSGK